jgi:hypothetical protein
MKRVAVHLGEKYHKRFEGHRLSQLGFLGYMYEICNFAHTGRNVGQISRALSHELDPISDEEVYAICEDLEALGYMTIEAAVDG